VHFLRVSWRQKASRFSGRRLSSRSVVGSKASVGSLSVAAASSAANERAGDSGCPKVAKEGNDVGLRSLSVDTGRRHETSSHALRDASFTRSFDPCTSILTMLCRGQTRLRWGALEGITAGQTRVTGMNQHWGQRSGRSAARRVSLLCQRSGVVRKKRKVVEATVPARKREFWFGCSHVVSSCRSR